MSFSERYRDRARAGAFGAVAEQYDRYRPPYPETLINRLLDLSPTMVLDIGCGTGKVAVELVNRGLTVLGLEPDQRMAAVARTHGVTVEVATLESWDCAGRTFDLITSGDAWHWIDPGAGRRKVAQLLNPGGVIARFWNRHEVEPALLDALQAVYAACAPDTAVAGAAGKSTRGVTDPFAGDESFSSFSSDTYEWELKLTVDEWCGLVSTFSDHQQLGPERLTRLLDGVRTAVDEHGGIVRTRSATFVQYAARTWKETSGQ